MTLPKAIASGPSAETPDAVRPVRTGILAGVIAALYLLVLSVALPVPTQVLGLFGGAKNDVERHGGLEMIWMPPPGMNESEIFARFHVGDDRAIVERSSDAYVIRVPGVRADQVEHMARRLGGEEGLEFHRILRVEEMKSLIQLLHLPMNGQEPVDADVDQWRPDDGRDIETRTDYYLIARRHESIVTALREAEAQGWRLPPDTRIALERFETEKGVFWRTYVIRDTAELDGGDIANATGSYDPNTNRPLVLLDFTREGGRKFGELTSEITGEKLATMIGDQIYSAPVINGAIRGGRASITMGAGSPQKQEQERDDLVATLRAGALPKGGEVKTARYVEPVRDEPQQWVARGAIAVGGGALIALLVWMIVRITRPVRRRALARPDAHAPWGRVFVTLLAPLAIYVTSKIIVIGISSDELLYEFGGVGFRDSYEHLEQQLSFGALGIMPVISAYVFVEVLSLIVPSWRRRRHAGPDARAPINAAVVITAGTLLFVQGWFVTTYIYALGMGNVELLDYGMAPRLLVIGSFAIGTLVLVGVAALIREHGLGNGFGVMLVSGWLVNVVGRWLDLPGLIDADFVIGGATILAAGIAIMVALRWRIARLGEAPIRVPTSGAVPLGEAGGLIALFGLIATFASEGMNVKIYEWTYTLRDHRWLLIGVLAGMTLLWSFAFARPAVTRKLAERVGLVAPAQNAWWSATLLSLALLLLVGAASTTLGLVRPTALWIADAMTIALVAAVALDLYADWRGRRVALERVWSLHQPQHADLVVRGLDEIGIPCHLSSANLRTVLAFFGPFAPIDVWVTAEHAPAARTRIRELVA